MNGKKMKSFSTLILIAIIVIIYIPIFYVIQQSFFGELGNFSLESYKSLLINPSLIKSTLNSILIALISAYAAVGIGTIISCILYINFSSKVQKFFITLNKINFMSPDILIAVTLLILFNILNLKFGMYTVVLAHIIFNIPVVIVNVYSKLTTIDDKILSSAFDLGATKSQVFLNIILPSISSTLKLVFFLSLIYSLDDFIVTFFVTGNNFSTLTIEIYSMVRVGISPEINAIFSIVIITIVFVSFIKYFKRRGINNENN